jgi:hypothetical protein
VKKGGRRAATSVGIDENLARTMDSAALIEEQACERRRWEEGNELCASVRASAANVTLDRPEPVSASSSGARPNILNY